MVRRQLRWSSLATVPPPARMLTAARPDLVCGVVMAEASAGELASGFTEKPYSRLRDAINGAGDPSLSVTKRIDCLQRA
jgi:hypothetical protein